MSGRIPLLLLVGLLVNGGTVAAPPETLPSEAAFPVQRLVGQPGSEPASARGRLPGAVPAGASFPSGTVIGLPVTAMPEAPSSSLPDRQDEILRWVLGSDVLFDFDKAVLRPAGKDELAKFLERIRSLPQYTISIEGHTDAIGSLQYNQDLSRRRAEAVSTFLTSSDPTMPTPTITAFGESRPAAPNEKPDGSDDPAGRQLNRRVELVLRSTGNA